MNKTVSTSDAPLEAKPMPYGPIPELYLTYD